MIHCRGVLGSTKGEGHVGLGMSTDLFKREAAIVSGEVDEVMVGMTHGAGNLENVRPSHDAGTGTEVGEKSAELGWCAIEGAVFADRGDCGMVEFGTIGGGVVKDAFVDEGGARAKTERSRRMSGTSPSSRSSGLRSSGLRSSGLPSSGLPSSDMRSRLTMLSDMMLLVCV